MAKIDDVLQCLNGDPENFRAILTDKDTLLAKVCEYAERLAKKKNRPPWAVMKEITGHGSGVSSAIYELYRKTPD